MFRSATLVIIAFWAFLQAGAMPAYKKSVLVKLSDGQETYITLKGDELCKWAVSEGGHILLHDSIGNWVYAMLDEDGYRVPSGWHLSAEENRVSGLSAFLARNRAAGAVKFRTSAPRRQREVVLKQSSSVVGARKALVILMSFKDKPFKKSRLDFNKLFNQQGYSEDGAIGSVHDYYRENSYGQLDLTCDVLGPYVSAFPMEYYGKNTFNGQDANPYALFKEAMEHVSGEVNLADYDMDGDGYLDNVHIIFAGYGEEAGADAAAIWSHESRFTPITMQGIKIASYSCAPELRGNRGEGISRIGPHCHEIGHALGAMDYYDTDYSQGGEYAGTGDWDVMASGSWNNDGIAPAHFNPYVKAYVFGWSEVGELPDGQRVTLVPSIRNKGGMFRKETPVAGEYYLLENRVREGFDCSLPGEGLMIYHIHKDLEGAASKNNVINAAFPQMCYPVCASSSYAVPTARPESFGEIDSDGCPFPGSSDNCFFSDATIPSSKCWDGQDSGISISDIRLDEAGVITLNTGSNQERQVVFKEGFEAENVLENWNVECLNGTLTWERQTKTSGDVGTLGDNLTPDAAEGVGYLSMKNKNFLTGGVSRVSTGRLDPGLLSKYILSFRYQVRSYKQQKGSIAIYYKPVSHTGWTLLKVLTEETSEWKLCEITLPASETEYQLAFEGTLNGMGGLFIDDLNVYKESGGMGIGSSFVGQELFSFISRKGVVEVQASEDILMDIYAVSGLFYGRFGFMRGKSTLSLPPQLYIGICRGRHVRFVVY